MRVRIIKPLAGVLEGRSLARLIPGLLYEMDDAFARQLISMGGAREETSQQPALVILGGDEQPDDARLTGGVRVVALGTADDRPDASTPDRRRGTADRRKNPRCDRRTLGKLRLD
jgi:hypothetical protein